MNEKYWIAFSAIEQLDSTFIQRLYNYFGDIETAYKSSYSDLKQIEGLSIKKAENFLEKRKKIEPDRVFDEVYKRGLSFITFDSPEYPYMLSQISNPPMVLYYKGNLFSCNLERTVAFVGSRKASFSGKEGVNKVISELAGTDLCIVSGLAAGIDAVSHKSAIENNLKTIGVIASGFDFTYPSTNKALYEQIESGCGAIVTEYYPTFEPLKFRFPERNRIVTGLSYGTVVGEAALKSGALISANLTLDQGRELMCIPGAITNSNTEGIYKLIKDGAGIVTKGEDILNYLGWEVAALKEDKQENIELSSIEKIIFDIIDIEPKGFDEIQSATKIETTDLLTLLTMMEIKGLIKQIEGDRYTKA